MPAQNPPAELSMSLTLGGGPTVGRLGFGAMRITGRGVWGPPPDESEAIALLQRHNGNLPFLLVALREKKVSNGIVR